MEIGQGNAMDWRSHPVQNGDMRDDDDYQN